MKALTYYLTLPFIYGLSILPFPALYLLSDGFYAVLFHIIGYRRKVVMANLRNSFPEKKEQELQVLCKDFYRYFCDLFLETFKTLTISKASMLKRCSMDPAAQSLFDRFAGQHQNIIIVMGHKGNWEWAGNTFSLHCRHQLFVIYHPLSNKFFDGLMYRMRTRFGTKLIAMKDTFRDMLQHRHDLNATAFIADQTPSPDKAHWMTFLHQDTPVFLGTEKIAQKLKYPIVYVAVKKIKRGFYTLTADQLELPSCAETQGVITEAHTKRLEADIKEQPDTWLWTHRRWKHKRVVPQ